ncbi:leucine-rich repeat and WD repeat-containing protein 1 isoform X2 [Notolabrus celidotus]|uniref:leucine-rich repeat and WD repeat-containing protein 1 isoform X2 n=1 Tax=Notolabrus celidotus TaxID=1203425 RepID=UPI00148F8D69|nr:leucine-rich repeat and WD repeat-containing protein 1 isoform X2 [Notolabrus celidotus]
MEKITEKLLLEKGSPKTNKLAQIKTLNLSKLKLEHKDLPVKLLSGLQSLERLDLSGNRLQELPKNLKLPALRHLDLSDNQMEDVTTLESLCGLEEVKMEDNLYITVSDNYKMMVLLPNLKFYNGKDITSTANHVRFVYSENLRTRINAVWEKSFSLPDPVTDKSMSALETKFVSMACQQVKFGPNSVSDFTKWRVEILAKEYLRSLTEPQEDAESDEDNDAKENCDVSTPSKRKQTDSTEVPNTSLTPRKRPRTDLPASPAADSPRKSSLRPKLQMLTETVRMSPRKAAQPPSTPTRGQKRAEPPRREAKVGQTKQKDVGKKESEGTELPESYSQTKPVHLKPLHVLQCHSKNDSSGDFSTQLWACAFQPLPDSTGAGGGSRLVATCGGDSLCVIDCETGMVMKKYKVPGEEFFSLSWSTVLMSRGGGASAQHCSILAAGGKRGLVKLIHPRNNVAYGEFRASRKSLSILRFNHHQGNFLFTGSYDKKIALWDIGGVDSQYNYKVVQLLVLEVSATPLHICLPPKSPNTHLLTACEDGLHCYNTQLGTNKSTKRSKDMEITFPIYKKADEDNDYRTIDGLNFLTDDIVASKNFMHGSIYLWSWSRTKAQRPDKKYKAVSAVVLAELQWANTEIPYLALNTCPGQAYIVCGDDRGKLWTYHVTDLQKNSLQTGKAILPTEVLEWPAPQRKGVGQVEGPSINSVAMDPELNFLVALSDKNMVIVWKRDQSS